ncbi:MAG: hypothetical protein FWG66_07035 [Spirochaetes bacterium]|nr:hypothetical protein [Spirochaetota bacterium]
MYSRLYLFGVLFTFASFAVFAEESDAPAAPGGQPEREVHQRVREHALTVSIAARIFENEEEVVWQEIRQRHTSSGNPVGLKLVGSNVVVVVQFTPFIRREGGSVLVAQGQVWLETPGEGIRYHTSIKTIPMEFDEPVIFFPLGTSWQGSGSLENRANIEIIVTTMPYTGANDALAAQDD